MSFGRTLGKGIERFGKIMAGMSGKVVSGEEAFELWDTYGFPVDLTQLMAEERGLQVNKIHLRLEFDRKEGEGLVRFCDLCLGNTNEVRAAPIGAPCILNW